MILVKEWSCNLSELLSVRQSMPLSAICSKGGTHGKPPMEDVLKLISNVPKKKVALNYLHILPPIRKCEIQQNLYAMIGATKAQFPK
jgi:hypothetical protein